MENNDEKLVIRFNCLLKLINKGDHNSFNKLHNVFKVLVESSAESMYSNIYEKNIFELEDLIQEIWLNLWVELTKDHDPIILTKIVDLKTLVNKVTKKSLKTLTN